MHDYLAGGYRPSLCYGEDPDLRRHVAAISGQRRKKPGELDESIQEAFRAWFLGFRPEHDVEKVFVLSLGRASDVQSQQLATPRETLDGHDNGNLETA